MNSVTKQLVEKQLSRREIQVVDQVIKGVSNREVANALFVTEKTIKFHLTNIYKKLNIRNRNALIVLMYDLQNPEKTASQS